MIYESLPAWTGLSKLIPSRVSMTRVAVWHCSAAIVWEVNTLRHPATPKSYDGPPSFPLQWGMKQKFCFVLLLKLLISQLLSCCFIFSRLEGKIQHHSGGQLCFPFVKTLIDKITMIWYLIIACCQCCMPKMGVYLNQYEKYVLCGNPQC